MQDYDRMQDKQILITENNKHEKHKPKPDRTQNMTHITVEAKVHLALRACDSNDAFAAWVLTPSLHCSHHWSVVRAVKVQAAWWNGGSRPFMPFLLETDLHTLRGSAFSFGDGLILLCEAVGHIDLEVEQAQFLQWHLNSITIPSVK